jgi:accessory gene regulator B
MFHEFAEDIAFWLISRKKADIEKREIYVYGLEVFLLNAGLITVLFVISVLAEAYSHFLMFLLFFVPLRMFAGGYHAKTSEKCFAMSAVMYITSLVIVRLFPLIYKSPYTIAAGLIFAVIIFLFAPVVNTDNRLSLRQIKRNKIIVRAMLCLDLGVFIVCYTRGYKDASSEVVFVGFVCVLMLAQKLANLKVCSG